MRNHYLKMGILPAVGTLVRFSDLSLKVSISFTKSTSFISSTYSSK